MEALGPIIFMGFIWVTLTWRCFAVTSICKEVAAGKTTKDALFFQLLQCGIFLFLAIYIAKSGRKDLATTITAISLLITGAWFFYSCARALIGLKKSHLSQSRSAGAGGDPGKDND